MYGLEVFRPIAFGVTRRQDSDLAGLQAAFVGHAPFADLLSALVKGVAYFRHPNEFGERRRWEHRHVPLVGLPARRSAPRYGRCSDSLPAAQTRARARQGLRGSQRIGSGLNRRRHSSSLRPWIPEDGIEAGPPEVVEVLALVDYDGGELCFWIQQFAGLH
jgi:hypothetical protein